jgi:hypothetical protein
MGIMPARMIRHHIGNKRQHAIMISNEGLLYIEPRQPASTAPMVDHLTRKMTAAFRAAKPSGLGYCGIHACVCSAVSKNRDFWLPNGEMTNSLCVHYVAHHRAEVPPDHLAKIEAFTFGEVEPTPEELQGPDLILARLRFCVESRLGVDRLPSWIRWGLDVDGLSRNLCYGLSPDCGDAQDLLTILDSIRADSLSCVKMVVEEDHGDVREWGEQALRILAGTERYGCRRCFSLSSGAKG